MSKSTKEDLDEQAKLEAELINLETARLKKAKTLTAEITTNLREAESERKAAVAKQKADQKAQEASNETDRHDSCDRRIGVAFHGENFSRKNEKKKPVLGQ